jgi:Amt family ammonium transporter
MTALLMCGVSAVAQRSAPAPAAAAPTPAAIAADTTLPVSGPSADEQAAGDPSGTKTGTANDIVKADPSKGITLTDLVNQVGQNRIGINFTWTLVCGFLVMFMQAGFAIVETGLTRAKNANHTMMMNFMVYGFGLFAYWVCGFAIQMGGAAGTAMLGGALLLTVST